MNKVEEYIKKTEEKGLKLNEYQKLLVYRCALIGLTEEQMDLFVAAGHPVIKEEMIIASLIDGIDDDYIRREIISDDDIDSIKRKRADYLMENFRSRDAEYNQLQEELIILQAQMKDVDKVIGRQKEEYVSLSKEIDEKKEEIRRLTEELKSRGSEDGCAPSGVRKETETRTVTKYKRPEGFKETVYCLLGKTDKLPEQSEKIVSDRQEFFNIVIDSDLSTEQIKEIEQAYKDGIEIKLIKKIANKSFTPERMRALRRMVCILNSKKYSETDSAAAGLTADEERMAYERAVDDCMVITDESVKGYEADLQHMISLPVTQTKPAEEKQN